jgi:hypothetical protein
MRYASTTAICLPLVCSDSAITVAAVDEPAPTIGRKSHLWESNPRPPDYKSGALPTELKWRSGPGVWPGRAI